MLYALWFVAAIECGIASWSEPRSVSRALFHRITVYVVDPALRKAYVPRVDSVKWTDPIVAVLVQNHARGDLGRPRRTVARYRARSVQHRPLRPFWILFSQRSPSARRAPNRQ